MVRFNVRLAAKLSVVMEDRDVEKLRTIVHTAAQMALFDYPDRGFFRVFTCSCKANGRG